MESITTKNPPAFDQPYDARMAAWRPAAVGSLANQTMPLLLRKFDSVCYTPVAYDRPDSSFETGVTNCFSY